MNKHTCPECGYDSPESTCLECGNIKVSEKICPECQASNSISERQCTSCGFPLLVHQVSSIKVPPETSEQSLNYQRTYKVVATVSILGLATFLTSLLAGSTTWGSRVYDMFDFGAENRAKISSVKANMHTFQTALETYAVDHGGLYPANIEDLYTEASREGYWKDFTNPLTEQSGLNATLLAYLGYHSIPENAGKVLYRPLVNLAENEYITSYQIYGLDKEGQLIKDREQPFILESVLSDISNYTTADPSLVKSPSKLDVNTYNSDLHTSSSDPSELASSQSDSERVTSVIKEWQNIKRIAFVQGDLSGLANVLTGTALEQTKGGANWWIKNGSYYSIELHELTVQDIQFSSDDIAKVTVKISETKNNSVDGEKYSSYTAIYHLTKLGSGWLIERMETD